MARCIAKEELYICFVYLDEKLVATTTLGTRGFSFAVSGVGHVCIMTCFAGRAGLLRPPKPSEVFPSAAREKKPLVSRVGGDLEATDILSACLKTDFGRIMRPDMIVQMRDNS